MCIDTSNLLGGPFQMVFTTNGAKEVLDNVYVLSHLNIPSAVCVKCFRYVGNTPSSCPNDAQHSVTSAYPCEAFAYPTRWTSSASVCAPSRSASHLAFCVERLRLRYLSFDDCDRPDYDASAVKNEVFLSGSCKSAGFRGSAWQFDNHFLLIDGIGGYFGGPVTLAVWFRLLKSPAQDTDSLILGIGVRGAVLNMGIIVASRCASEYACCFATKVMPDARLQVRAGSGHAGLSPRSHSRGQQQRCLARDGALLRRVGGAAPSSRSAVSVSA